MSTAERHVGDLLALIEQLAGEGSALESPSELFPRAFATLFRCVTFDVGLVVMIEQNLELHITTRAGAATLVTDELIARTRQTLQTLFPMSFETTEVMVISESNDLPPRSGEADALRFETHALLSVQNRTAGLLLLYRGEAPFRQDEQQIAAITATQVSMLLGNLRSRERILNLADTDDLTGIWNKRFFRRQLPQEIERARVYSVPLSLLLFDLDDFKQINDSFGHTVGDVVLSELCGAVREMLRPPDLFARFGGDEFAIILPHTDLGGACAVARRILDRLSDLTIPTEDDGFIRPAISIGVAEFRTSEDATANDLVRRADERLYESKRVGKNRYTA
ncbi:MAG TPA: GGDEF domain-containing protein [Thermoanaerobaculia bacterium]|nr:GGDEF domain-containing protein [Thermoanaerobaculia bacterium]